ncbi:hypothetical protein [Rhizobium mulingense]|uniref:hypothetical protein n=1 Tax=Rhizobium mulingense TaxID=3031128 RepID=UPI002B487B7B|nr:hypothetical protein [Rhizobium sp. MJ21]MEB3045542.1 hypothetical protein [Rhizobium sp. MJ21]
MNTKFRGQNILLETDEGGGREKGRYFGLSAALIVASLWSAVRAKATTEPLSSQ